MTDSAVSCVSSGTSPQKGQLFTPTFQLPLWTDIQHESDEELLQRYESCTHPVGYDDLGTSFLVFRIAVDAVMKLSDAGDCEVNAVTLVAEHTTVPVPSILRVIHSEKGVPGRRYIIMRYIPGRNLEECWATLSWWRKTIILWTLRRYVRQFRKIPLGNRPPGPIGDGPQVCTGPAFTEIYVSISLPPRSGQKIADHNVGID